MRDLTDASNEEVAAERAKVATEGWGARLLARQQANGRYARKKHAIDGEHNRQSTIIERTSG